MAGAKAQNENPLLTVFDASNQYRGLMEPVLPLSVASGKSFP